MTSFCFFVQLADRTLILKQKEFFVFMIASRLFLNHSPSEWFSFIQKGCEPFQVRILIMILFYSFSASATIPPTKRPEV